MLYQLSQCELLTRKYNNNTQYIMTADIQQMEALFEDH